jgi:NitT/TauT family transport system substrate-binding protein
MRGSEERERRRRPPVIHNEVRGMKVSRRWLVAATIVTLVLSACTAGDGGEASGGDTSELDSVRLQLQWVPQAQFGGYFAAQELGYYEEEGLAVEFVDGGPDVIPQQVGSAPDGPEFTISWVPKVLQAREEESDLVNIAQIFQ